MIKLAHSMIRVTNLDTSIEFYHQLLDLEVARRTDFESFSLVYLKNKNSNFELELTYNHQPTSYSHGSGYGHLAATCDDIEHLHRKCMNKGYQPDEIKSFYNGEELVATFFFIKDPDGYSIEVIKRSENYE